MLAQNLTFDWTINLGHILTVLSAVAGGYAFMVALRNKLEDLSVRVLKTEEQLVELVKVLIAQGKHETRMDAFDHRFNLQGERLDNALRRLDAYVDRASR